MRLRKLHIHRMPGIETPFAVEAKPGLNLIKGPNGSGKSTICQAVRHLLWPREESPTWLDLQSWWEDDGDELHATRQGLADTRWQRNG